MRHFPGLTGSCATARSAWPVPSLHVKFDCRNTPLHGGTALSDHGRAVIRNCVFEYLDCAIRDYGGINLILENCVFQNNGPQLGIDLQRQGLDGGGLLHHAGPRPDRYRCWLNPAKKVKQYPRFKSERHIVEVTDSAGKPVSKAQVTVRAVPQSGLCGKRDFSLTDAAAPRGWDRPGPSV